MNLTIIGLWKVFFIYRRVDMTRYVMRPSSGFSYDGAVLPRTDIAELCVKHGWTPVDVRMFGEFRSRDLSYFEEHLTKNQVNEILIQSPFYNSNPQAEQEWLTMLKRLSVRTIGLIHDADVIRFGGDATEAVKLYNQYDSLLVPSRALIKVIEEKAGNLKITTPIITYPFWYYPVETKRTATFKPTVSFAGNLTKSKARFIYEDDSSIYTIYGQSNDMRITSRPNYKGAFNRNKLYSKLKGFGLVWDGSVEPSTENNYTNYTQYNQSYKASLYLARGLPLIVWKDDMIAPFVKERGIGIVLPNLLNINTVVSVISEQTYNEMVANVKPLQEQIISGDKFYEVITQAMVFAYNSRK